MIQANGSLGVVEERENVVLVPRAWKQKVALNVEHKREPETAALGVHGRSGVYGANAQTWVYAHREITEQSLADL